MSKLLDDAMEVLRDLPKNMQETAARAIMDYAATFDDVQLSDDQAAEVQRRMDDANRSFLSLSEVEKGLRHFGV